MDPLSALKNEAIKKAQDSGKLEDVERVASVYQLMAEAQKRSAEAATERRLARQEGLKFWAMLLVPLLSVLALAVVVFGQMQLQRESQRGREDEQWRAAISDFSTASTSANAPLIAGLLPQVRLKPYLKSPIYGEQANQLARLLLPRLADPDALRDLFAAVVWHDLDQMISVDRGLNRLYDNLGRQRQRLEAFDTRGASAATSPKPAGAAGSAGAARALDQRAEQLAADQNNLSREISYVCDQIGDAARAGKFTTTGLAMDDGWYNYCDLSKVDWSGASLSGALFQQANLEGARFANVTEVDNLDIANTEWWKAAELSPSLLRTLMDNFDPGTEAQSKLADKPTKAAYVARVVQLCKAAKVSCPPASIKFTVPATPKPGAAPAGADGAS